MPKHLNRLRALEDKKRASTEASTRREAPGKLGQNRGILGTVFVVLILVATKGKFVFLFLITKAKWLFGALKFGKLITTLSTMWLSIVVYSSFYGWKLAVGIVVLILVHEYGHGIAAKIMKLEVGAPIFIPFFGAVIALKEQPKSTWIDAVVGFGGPLAGALGGMAVLLIGYFSPVGEFQGLCYVVAWFTFLINYFNLMPVWNLDGDRISRPFTSWHWVVGIVLLIGVMVWQTQIDAIIHPMMYFVIALGAFKWWRLFRAERQARQGEVKQQSALEKITHQDPYTEESSVTPGQRHGAAVAYFGIAIALSTLMVIADNLKPQIDPATKTILEESQAPEPTSN